MRWTLGVRIPLSLLVSLVHGQSLMITEKFDEAIFALWSTFPEKLLMRMIVIIHERIVFEHRNA
ncbi:hypothetical protein K435DRAFT_779934 [Dendrothele bispora CBS 962.96]|uniref:Secreted protein n=1 Tax=Dendrothele bispora (strain CBS 962.96) TaxID=1314807 RepID=A0A4S8LW18_DENBC|nr:hypothetical protein K435DRAFT_779934 [Dendrothele bispora CBS 962.96]